MSDLERTLEEIKEFSTVYKTMTYEQAGSLVTALLRPPARIRCNPCPPRPRPIKVVPKEIMFEAFQMNEWTYHSILTWPEWLQQTDIIKIAEGGRLWYEFRAIKVSDWLILGPKKYPFLVSHRDFVEFYHEVFPALPMLVDQINKLKPMVIREPPRSI